MTDDGPDTGYSLTHDRDDYEEDIDTGEYAYWRMRESLWQHGGAKSRRINYFTEAPLHQLEEWNEEVIFEGRNPTVSHGELGVMVTMEFRHLTPVFEDGKLIEFDRTGSYWTQLCAVYGDDDELCRLVIFHDTQQAMHRPETIEYINHRIRSQK